MKSLNCKATHENEQKNGLGNKDALCCWDSVTANSYISVKVIILTQKSVIICTSSLFLKKAHGSPLGLF